MVGVSRREFMSLAGLLGVALVLRLGWGLLQPAVIDERLPDQREYLELAENLIAGEGLWFYDPRFYQDVKAFRTPGYPVFLAALGANVRAARAAQALLDVSTVLAAYLLARKWMGHWPSFMAAFLVAFNPFLVYFSGLILTETLYTAMLAWGMVLLAWERNFLWGGLVLAVSVLVRPSAVLLTVALGYAAVFATRVPGEIDTKRRPWMRVPVGATMLVLTALVLTPWAVRNKTVVGTWVVLTTNGGVTKYDGFHPEADGSSDQRFLATKEFATLRQLNEVQRDRVLSEKANEWIRQTWRERPRDLMKLTLLKVARTWSPVPLSDDFGSRWIYRAAALAFSIPFYLLVVVGLWTGPRKGGLSGWGKLFLLTPAVYFTLVHAMTVGSLRYRVPVEPLLAVLAASGVMVIGAQFRPPEWKRAGEGADPKI